MDSLDSLRDVWHRLPQPAAPDVRTIIAAARRGRFRLIAQLAGTTVVLLGTVLYIAWGMWHWEFAYVTTKVGMALAILAVLAAIVANSSLLRLLLGRADTAADSQAYLQQLYRYQQRQRWLHTTGIRIYTAVLGLGMALYLFEFAARSWRFGLIAYGATAAWFAIVWFIITPRTIRKQTRALDELIEQVARIAGQL